MGRPCLQALDPVLLEFSRLSGRRTTVDLSYLEFFVDRNVSLNRLPDGLSQSTGPQPFASALGVISVKSKSRLQATLRNTNIATLIGKSPNLVDDVDRLR